MFEIELKSPEKMLIRLKNDEIVVDIMESSIAADIKTKKIFGAGEFEIGGASIMAVALENGNGVFYRIKVEGVKIGLISTGATEADLEELGPIDILGTNDTKIVSVVEPKIVVPMANMDFAELKGEVKVEKKLKIKNAILPDNLEIYCLSA